MANLDLPHEILLHEIFLRLPIKSLGRFRWLSKTWNAQLSTSQFINLHKIHHQKLVILSEYGHDLHLITPPSKHDDVWSPLRILPDCKWKRLFGSCNGLLLLLQRKTRNLLVVNPVTRKQVLIPNPPLVLRKEHVNSYGFGYDSASNDYKVVAVTCDSEECTNVEVYSMQKRVWKTLDYPLSHSSHYKLVMPFVNGALHWFTNTITDTEQYGRVCALDLATESFCDTPLPKGLSPAFCFDGLVLLRGCLANVTNFNHGAVDVWVMNEYGVQDSWERFHMPNNNMWVPVQPLCLVGDEKMLCTAGRKMQCWFVYDLKEGMQKFRVGGQNLVSYTDWMVFEESLVSPE